MVFLEILKESLNNLFIYYRLEVLQIVFVVVGVVMALFAILLVIFAYLATGATRKNVYSGASCIMGGRISAAFVSVSSGVKRFAIS